MTLATLLCKDQRDAFKAGQEQSFRNAISLTKLPIEIAKEFLQHVKRDILWKKRIFTALLLFCPKNLQEKQYLPNTVFACLHYNHMAHDYYVVCFQNKLPSPSLP